MKRVGWCLCLIFALLSCAKEEEGTCFDSVLSSGEVNVDCGGVCPPCTSGNGVSEFFLATINGVSMQFSQRTLVDAPSWILNFSNDTLAISLNLGNGTAPGAYAIEAAFTEATMNGKAYDYVHEGLVVLADIDTANRRLSGFFEAKLVGYFSDSLLVDTLRITNGDFESIPY
ncbi:MAG: hypothetical protein P8O07_03385 [Crocinitomicaceae bacterium]|nr:hypothetical protein [Crocinitomicaceae bacterium]